MGCYGAVEFIIWTHGRKCEGVRLLHLIALTHWPWRAHVGLGALTLTVNHPTLMWFPGQAAFQFRPFITYSDTNRGRMKQRYSNSDEDTISTQISTSSCCLMSQTTNINAHTCTLSSHHALQLNCNPSVAVPDCSVLIYVLPLAHSTRGVRCTANQGDMWSFIAPTSIQSCDELALWLSR